MNKFLLLALLFSPSLFASEVKADMPVLTTEVTDEEKPFNPRESHWLSSFGFETLKYQTPFEFVGEKEKFSPSKKELWGGRLGFGAELYLGGGILTTTKVEGYYTGTLFARVLNAGPSDDIDFAYRKTTGQVYGVDVSQSLSFMFDMKTKNPIMDEWAYLTVEPFIEAGVGKAWAYNRLNYHYDTTGSSGPGVKEDFRQKVSDDLLNTRLGGGINFTSSGGYFLYLKGTVNRYDVVSRKTETFKRPNGGAGVSSKSTDKSVSIDPVMVYAIGGGYKF